MCFIFQYLKKLKWNEIKNKENEKFIVRENQKKRKIVLHFFWRTLVEFYDVSAKWQSEISNFKVLTTTWTHNSRAYILYISNSTALLPVNF